MKHLIMELELGCTDVFDKIYTITSEEIKEDCKENDIEYDEDNEEDILSEMIDEGLSSNFASWSEVAITKENLDKINKLRDLLMSELFKEGDSCPECKKGVLETYFCDKDDIISLSCPLCERIISTKKQGEE